MFQKILIANRGEIAVRVLRACKEMGIPTVAVFSEVDRTALHTRYSDEAYCIGPPPARESYLDIDKIIDAAIKSGAQAIHPGYGFLAENPLFAERCEREGIKLIGPSAYAMRTMGSKTAGAKNRPGGGRSGCSRNAGTDFDRGGALPNCTRDWLPCDAESYRRRRRQGIAHGERCVGASVIPSDGQIRGEIRL